MCIENKTEAVKTGGKVSIIRNVILDASAVNENKFIQW
jgi:hypothetical protein